MTYFDLNLDIKYKLNTINSFKLFKKKDINNFIFFIIIC